MILIWSRTNGGVTMRRCGSLLLLIAAATCVLATAMVLDDLGLIPSATKM
jgi:hypothetical protein